MSDIFGAAHTTTEAEITQRMGEPGADSIYLGRYYDPKLRRAGSEILYGDDRHLLVFGPTGSGKGRRFLIPNLLRGLREQSVIVIDPKGEAAEKTAAARKEMGHDVVILNPFNVRDLGSAGFNPLAALDPASASFYDDAAAIGEALIKTEGSDPHWSESARGLIVALLMWEKLRNGDSANLENIRALLTEPADRSEPDGDGKSHPVSGLRVTAARMTDKGGYEIASLAARFIEPTRETASIQSTADTQTRWLLSQQVREDLRKNGLDFSKLRDRPTTVFVVLPAERLRTHGVWLRLVIVSALNALYKKGGRRVLMLVDEMAALGHLASLEDAFGLIRGYNIQIAAFLQDLGQLKNLYKERWETFIANAGVVFGFAPNDLTTAEWMSKRSGQTTVVAKGFSQNSGSAGGEKTSTNAGISSSDQQIARPLILPHELFGLEKGMGILWLAGLDSPTRMFAPDYEKIKECREQVGRRDHAS